MSAMLMGVALFGLIAVTTLVSSVEVRESRNAIDDVRARFLAETGIEMGFDYLDSVTEKSFGDPLGAIGDLFVDGEPVTPFVREPVISGTSEVGSYSLTISLIGVDATTATVRLEATGYVWMGAEGAAARILSAWHAISATAQYSLEPSEVFDYAYFVNNWGWLYGNTIYVMGNARSNGQFDVAGYKPTITGQPVYDSVAKSGATVSLSGYRDDNEDGLQDGNDGGIFSGWDIVKAHNVIGAGGNASNQHDFDGKVDMPNLSNLAGYKDQARAAGSSISIGGSVVTDEVYGDEAGERQNLYLVGTAADPIVLDGPVVVEGDVMISGYVTGQGAIYSGGNVYCPDSIRYLDGPTSARPTDNTQAQTEDWLETNWDKDFLGLFARENIVLGDHTDSWWRSPVSGWMASSMNASKEDAGEDGIPNTEDGMDGVAGTADDDLLEGDGSFTTEHYTQSDEDYGFIPDGMNVGDVIPGTGEDIDGDGVQDGTTTLADIDLSSALNTTNWGGNMPPGGIANYSDVATLEAEHFDAVFYTNHSFCYVVYGSNPATINGAIVTRNENIVYGTPKITVNYDARMLGGNTGMAADFLPRELRRPVVQRWLTLDADPNRYSEAAP